MSHYIPSPTKYPVVYFVNLFYQFFIPGVLGGMAILVVLDVSSVVRQKRRKSKGQPKPPAVEPPTEASPAKKPSTDQPTAAQPSKEPSATAAPVVKPPTQEPPVADQPAAAPPAEEPPTEETPAAEPPTDKPVADGDTEEPSHD
jgi:type IV secretory pathway VirB10-like protein